MNPIIIKQKPIASDHEADLIINVDDVSLLQFNAYYPHLDRYSYYLTLSNGNTLEVDEVGYLQIALAMGAKVQPHHEVRAFGMEGDEKVSHGTYPIYKLHDSFLWMFDRNMYKQDSLRHAVNQLIWHLEGNKELSGVPAAPSWEQVSFQVEV